MSASIKTAPCPACRLPDRITKPITGESRFCYHLNYWLIIRTHRTHTVRLPCMTTGPVTGVVFRLTSRNHSPLRQSKLLAGRTFTPSQLVASHLRGWGSRLKRTTSSPVAHRHTSERVRSTMMVGVPALISFVVPWSASNVPMHLFINFVEKPRKSWSPTSAV
jgi:hypothetical protein